MKKQKQLLLWIVGVFLVLFSFSIKAQNFSLDLRNRTQPTCNSFEFDVYLKAATAGNFQFAMCQLAISMNPLLENGGVIMVTPVLPNAVGLNASQVPGPAKFSYDAVNHMILVTAVSPPGNGNGTIISATGSGTKYIRIRVTNSVSYPAQATNLAWSFADSPLKTKVFAYVAGTNTDISANGTFNTTTMTSPANTTALLTTIAVPVAQTVTGNNGTYCGIAGATGAPVGLAASVNGVAYQLWKDGTAVPGAIIFGRTAVGGVSSISFGNQTQGLYQVSAYVCGSGLFPTSATILAPTTPENVSVAITTDQPGDGLALAGLTTVTFTANPDAFSLGTAMTLDWYVNGLYQYSGSAADLNFVYDVNVGDVVQVQMNADPTACVTPAVATAQVTMHSQGPALFTLSGAATVCEGATPPVTLSGSEVGYTYQLYVDGTTAYQLFKNGTGAPLVWNVGLVGNHTYTCVASSPATPMTGSATIQVDPNLTLTNSISTPLTTLCSNTSVTITCTHNYPVASCDWYVNGTIVANGMDLTYTPLNGDAVYCVCHTTTGACWTATTATSNTINFVVNATSNAPADVISVCDGPYSWHGQLYATTGIYHVTENCVTYTLDLTITPSSNATADVVSVCDGPYTWHGTPYSVSGLYHVVENCVTYTLDLTITPSSNAPADVVSVCDGPYTWHGQSYATTGIYHVTTNCVTYTLDLTVTPSSNAPADVVSVCDGPYTWHGQSYATTGIYHVTDACVTYTLDLTVTPSSNAPADVVSV
ncbi:MAG: hypothetical protein WCL06_03200, partial [Bacteroidota bacterium]